MQPFDRFLGVYLTGVMSSATSQSTTLQTRPLPCELSPTWRSMCTGGTCSEGAAQGLSVFVSRSLSVSARRQGSHNQDDICARPLVCKMSVDQRQDIAFFSDTPVQSTGTFRGLLLNSAVGRCTGKFISLNITALRIDGRALRSLA